MCKLPLLHGFAMTSPLARGGLIDFRVKQIPKARYRRACKGTGVQHIGTDWQSVRNKRDSKAGDPVSLHGSLCDPKKHFEYLYFVQQSIIFALEKSTAVSLAFKVEMRMFLFQGKRRRTFLLYCDKRNQKHRKGKGDSPSLFHLFPFDNYG